MNDMIQISRKKALEIIRLHRLIAIEKGRCQQCQNPFHDGLCECEPDKDDDDWLQRCQQVSELYYHFEFPEKELNPPKGFFSSVKGFFLSKLK